MAAIPKSIKFQQEIVSPSVIRSQIKIECNMKHKKCHFKPKLIDQTVFTVTKHITQSSFSIEHMKCFI